MGDANTDAVVRQMRDQIIDNDVKLLQAVNKRLELVAKLRAYKEAHEMGFVDHAREDWMKRYLLGANQGPISDGGVLDLFENVLALTKRETTSSVAEDVSTK